MGGSSSTIIGQRVDLVRTSRQEPRSGLASRSFSGDRPFRLAAAKMSLPLLPNRGESTIRWFHGNLFGRCRVKVIAGSESPFRRRVFWLVKNRRNMFAVGGRIVLRSTDGAIEVTHEIVIDCWRNRSRLAAGDKCDG